MTSEEIDRLEAGRAADALLAEFIPLPDVRLECVPWQPARREPYWRYTSAGYREKFRPTTDPAAAAVVLEWLRAFRASRAEQGSDPHEEGPTAGSELAICKAALLAIFDELFLKQENETSCGDEVPSISDEL